MVLKGSYSIVCIIEYLSEIMSGYILSQFKTTGIVNNVLFASRSYFVS